MACASGRGEPLRELIVETDPAAAVIERVVAAWRARGRERFALALPGGSVASAVFPLLAGAPIDWASVDLFWGDERAVPPEHPDANYALAVQHMPEVLARAGVHRMPADAPDLSEAAQVYERTLREATEERGLDFVLAGLGPDGHLCSLFPGHALLEERARWVRAITDSPKPPPARLTLTMPALAAARELVVMAVGASKADVVSRCMRGEDLPAVRATDRDHAVLVVDRAAALGDG